MPSELSSLYKNKPVNLWVEDELTRTWLHQLWQDTDIGLLVAAGNEAVLGAVRDARKAGHANVYGFRDRDFLPTNRAKWLDQTKQVEVFIPEVFEVENYLLDANGLAALDRSVNPLQRTAQEITQHLCAVATESLWWMAVRATIAEVRVTVTDKFPEHPKLSNPSAIQSRADAEAELEKRVVRSTWGTGIKAWAPTLDLALLMPILSRHEAALMGELNSGAWQRTWSGKELVKRLKNHLGHNDDADLAKALARHYRSTGAPQELGDLRIALRKRAGVDPW